MGFLDDVKMGLGMKEKTQDYKDRTEKTKAVNKAISSGDPSAFKDDPAMMSRYKREELMNRMGGASDKSGIASLVNRATSNLGGLTEQNQYDENLRRYNEYLQSQGQLPRAGGKGALTVAPQRPEVTPDMRREALNIFESQQGAGQVPYYMAAARNAQNPNMSPAFQYAAQNYDVLGGSQRLAPRPMEMMSVAERQRINDMAQGMADRQYQQDQYQAGMDMVLRGGGKGGGATIPQTGGGMPRPPLPFASILASRFGGFGGQ